MKLVTILGARPQFVKAATVSRAISNSVSPVSEVIVHTDQIPCVTLRNETEWTELLELGWNRLAPPDSTRAVFSAIRAALDHVPLATAAQPYGNGQAAERIVELLAG